MPRAVDLHPARIQQDRAEVLEERGVVRHGLERSAVERDGINRAAAFRNELRNDSAAVQIQRSLRPADIPADPDSIDRGGDDGGSADGQRSRSLLAEDDPMLCSRKRSSRDRICSRTAAEAGDGEIIFACQTAVGLRIDACAAISDLHIAVCGHRAAALVEIAFGGLAARVVVVTAYHHVLRSKVDGAVRKVEYAGAGSRPSHHEIIPGRSVQYAAAHVVRAGSVVVAPHLETLFQGYRSA